MSEDAPVHCLVDTSTGAATPAQEIIPDASVVVQEAVGDSDGKHASWMTLRQVKRTADPALCEWENGACLVVH